MISLHRLNTNKSKFLRNDRRLGYKHRQEATFVPYGLSRYGHTHKYDSLLLRRSN